MRVLWFGWKSFLRKLALWESGGEEGVGSLVFIVALCRSRLRHLVDVRKSQAKVGVVLLIWGELLNLIKRGG